jgi:hypothetical protein
MQKRAHFGRKRVIKITYGNGGITMPWLTQYCEESHSQGEKNKLKAVKAKMKE